MNCPYCGFKFKTLVSNGDIPDFAPILCEDCLKVGLCINGVPQQITPSQLEAVKSSPAWRDMIEPSIKIIEEAKRQKIPPVDRSKRTLTDGSPETPDHRSIDPATGMQKGYIVLSAEERAKGFVRPVRRTYTHNVCGDQTTMNAALAETYARDPEFYDGTFCSNCKTHRPLSEFVWTGTAERVGS